MRDDAIYCKNPNGAEIDYIPFWRHEWLRARDRRTVKALSLAVGAYRHYHYPMKRGSGAGKTYPLLAV